MAYSEKVGVFELDPDDSAFKQLFKNIVTKSLHKYWHYLVFLAVVLGLTLFGSIRIARKFWRRRSTSKDSQLTT